MSRVVRCLVMWLMVLAVPVQGLAAAARWHCGGDMGSAPVDRLAPHDAGDRFHRAWAVAAAADGGEADAPVMQGKAGHAGHARHLDLGMHAVAHTDHLDHPVTPPHHGAGATDCRGHACSACAACCLFMALPATPPPLPMVMAPGQGVTTVPAARPPSFVTSAPERPPRPRAA